MILLLNQTYLSSHCELNVWLFDAQIECDDWCWHLYSHEHSIESFNWSYKHCECGLQCEHRCVNECEVQCDDEICFNDEWKHSLSFKNWHSFEYNLKFEPQINSWEILLFDWIEHKPKCLTPISCPNLHSTCNQITFTSKFTFKFILTCLNWHNESYCTLLCPQTIWSLTASPWRWHFNGHSLVWL